ncbi:alpha/beta hydrolase [Aliiglaciecola sp. 3_MG-2023]|uniref:alpha/beta fold hydrolase n=1 Tax=Aliiglaciecola sp. 3_MG-2023 TaxID=3062644 RepID=UPI0026E2B536|nr:alpha/beta hydrolase [Aliiglaciecola sp. 3_MG-2023]MDO6694301.1 alpha/beta hydrolase [Aliiglaciecola sp. 3_MG-2023]
MIKRLATLLGSLFLLLVAIYVVLFILFQQPDKTVAELAPTWAPAPSQFIDIGGMQIHLRDEGPKNDPLPIVLLHGTSSSLHTWEGWTQALASQRRVIRFDLPGFGLTGPHAQNDYSIEQYSQTVIDIMDSLGIERFVLAGNSLGGYISWATAVFYPQRVEKLILVDASGYPYQSASVPLAFTISQQPLLKLLVGDMLPRSLVVKSVKNVYGDPSKVTPELVERYYQLTTREGNRQALAARFAQTQPSELINRISEIKQPTLIMWGQEDRLIPVDLGRRFQEEIENSELVIFATLGHVPHEEDPESTVKSVIDFLQP